MNKKKMLNSIKLFILFLGALLTIVPFIWALLTSFKTMSGFLRSPLHFSFTNLTLENYRTVLFQDDIIRYALNSLVITTLNVVGLLFSCSMVGYAIGILRFKGSNVILAAAIGTLFLPNTATLIPVFLIWNALGAVGTYIPLVAPSFFGSAFGIFLLCQFYRTLPKEFYDASRIDGCNPFQAFLYIYLPLTKTTLAALSVFTFISSWGDYLNPLIYIQEKARYTLTIGLAYLKGQYTSNIPAQMAGTVLTILPVIMIFIALQDYFIEGIASTGRKA